MEDVRAVIQLSHFRGKARVSFGVLLGLGIERAEADGAFVVLEFFSEVVKREQAGTRLQIERRCSGRGLCLQPGPIEQRANGQGQAATEPAEQNKSSDEDLGVQEREN